MKFAYRLGHFGLIWYPYKTVFGEIGDFLPIATSQSRAIIILIMFGCPHDVSVLLAGFNPSEISQVG